MKKFFAEVRKIVWRACKVEVAWIEDKERDLKNERKAMCIHEKWNRAMQRGRSSQASSRFGQ